MSAQEASASSQISPWVAFTTSYGKSLTVYAWQACFGTFLGIVKAAYTHAHWHRIRTPSWFAEVSQGRTVNNSNPEQDMNSGEIQICRRNNHMCHQAASLGCAEHPSICPAKTSVCLNNYIVSYTSVRYPTAGMLNTTTISCSPSWDSYLGNVCPAVAQLSVVVHQHGLLVC
jgi:hypothetical protein